MRVKELIWKTRVVINLVCRGLWYPIHWLILRYGQSVRRVYAKQAFSWWHKKAVDINPIEAYYCSQLAHPNEAATEVYLWKERNIWVLTRVYGPKEEIERFYQEYHHCTNLKMDAEEISFSRWVGIWNSAPIHGWVKSGHFEAPAGTLNGTTLDFISTINPTTFDETVFAIENWYVNEIAYKRKLDNLIYFTTLDEIMRQFYFTKAIYKEIYNDF